MLLLACADWRKRPFEGRDYNSSIALADRKSMFVEDKSSVQNGHATLVGTDRCGKNARRHRAEMREANASFDDDR